MILRLPIYFVIFICFLALFSSVVSNEVYLKVLGEPSYIYGDFIYAFMIISSCFFFCFSYVLALRVRLKTVAADNYLNSIKGLNFYLLLIITGFLIFYGLIIVFKSISPLTIYIALTGGDEVALLRKEIAEEIAAGSAGWVLPFILGILTYLYLCLEDSSRARTIAWFLCCLLFVVLAFVTLTRASVFKLVFIIFFLNILKQGLGVSYIFKSRYFMLFLILIAFFIFIQITRQYDLFLEYGALYLIEKTFLGYFGASFNRAGAILEGDYVLPGSGGFYYSLSFFWNYPIIPDVLGLKSVGLILDNTFPVTSLDAYLSNFESLRNSSLSNTYNWPSIFGIVFSEFGMLFFVYFSILGLFYGRVFRGLFYKKTQFNLCLSAYLLNSLIWWVSGTGAYDRYFSIYVTALVFCYYFSRFNFNNGR